MKIRVLGLSILIAIALAVVFISNALAVSKQIDDNANSIMASIDQAVTQDPSLAASSNPYTYVENNKNFDNIVALGPDALPVLAEKVKNSKEDGLREYILAIAAEKIAKVNLKGNDFGWESGKDWATTWHKHLVSIPNKVDSIASSNDDNAKKNRDLVSLGTPAIPFIVDKVEQGKTELAPAISALLKDSSIAGFDSDTRDLSGWAKANKHKFDNLRAMVEDARK